jgi:hypothetical protein
MQTLMSTDTLQFILRIAGTAVTALVLSGVCVLLILAILRRISIKNVREHTIRLSNQGNVASVFQLAIFPLQQQGTDLRRSLLGFKFLLNSTPLAEIPADVPAKPVQAPKPVEPKKSSKASGSKSNAKAGQDAKKNFEKKGDAVASAAGNAGSLIGMIGSLLPGAAGRAMKEESGKLREVQKKTKDVVDKPTEIDRKADAFKKSGERLGVKAPTGTKKEVVDESSAAPTGGDSTVSEPETEAAPTPAPQPKRLRASGIPDSVYCVQTPQIDPGSSMTLTLQIQPRKRQFPEYSYPYTLISQQIPTQSIDQETKPVLKEGLVHLKPIASWRYGLRIFSGVFLVAASLSAFAFIFMLIWK